jgi:hypothetical protein
MRRIAGARARFWIQTGFAVVASAIMLLTMSNAEWFEALTGTNPDGGTGALEVVTVGLCFLATIFSGTLARREWLRASQPA